MQLQLKRFTAWVVAGIFLVLVMTPLAIYAQTTAQTAAQTGVVNRSANLRAGPGTRYAIAGSAPAGATVVIAATNPAGDWYHLSSGKWIAAFLVDTAATSSPPPASTPTLAPTPAPVHLGAAPATSDNDFVLVERRLWDVYENGGKLDGPSVHCGNDRRLLVNVLNAEGSRINGVAVQVQYGAREIEVTGAQGKGDGVAEFVLGGGQDVKVIRDAGGAPVTSDIATGLSTSPANIEQANLIAARYCQDEESCRHFAATYSCIGHFSWTVTFQQR